MVSREGVGAAVRTGPKQLCRTGFAERLVILQEHGAFTLVLSGGSLFQALAGLVGRPSIDYAKWHVMFVDERNVPHSSPDSNYKGAYDAFLSKARASSNGMGISGQDLHSLKGVDMQHPS